MNEEKYYLEIKNLIETYEVNRKVRNLQDNSEKLRVNWKIGKLLVEAQGGSKRARYKDALIKKWAEYLSQLYGTNYSYTNLKYMRQFYKMYPIGHTVCDQLSWPHYR